MISQQLLPDREGRQIPACEVMQMTGAVRSLIRDNKNHQIESAIAAGSKDGMRTMDQTPAALCREGRITRETALEYADRPDQVARLLG